MYQKLYPGTGDEVCTYATGGEMCARSYLATGGEGTSLGGNKCT